MSASLVEPTGWRNGVPPVVAEGIRDGDAVVYELVPMHTFVFDGAASTFQSMPLPVFDSKAYRRGTWSLMIHSVSGFSSGSRVRLWIENAVQSSDDPSAVFASLSSGLTVETTPAPPTLKTGAWATVGPGGRLRIEWQQGAAAVSAATARFSVWLTLRRR